MNIMTNKKLISLIVLSFLLLVANNTFSQRKQGYILYHKNGSVVRGIIEKQTADSIIMKTKYHNRFVFARKDMLGMNIYNLRVKPCRSYNKDASTRGIYSYSTVGLLTGNSEVLDDFTFSMQTSAGYEFNRWIGVGLGVGLEKLRTEILPFSLHLKSHILNFPRSPFVSVNIGYSIPLSKEKDSNYNYKFKYEGGFHYGVDLGIASFRSNNYALTITAGYKYQRLTEINDYGEPTPWSNPHYKEFTTYNFHKISVRIGFMFRFNRIESGEWRMEN